MQEESYPIWEAIASAYESSLVEYARTVAHKGWDLATAHHAANSIELRVELRPKYRQLLTVTIVSSRPGRNFVTHYLLIRQVDNRYKVEKV